MPATLSIPACCPDEVRRLAAALGVQRVTAEVLVRRGLADPAAAQAFLESDGPLHDPFALGDVEAACVLIENAIAAGRPIVVHGDYDVGTPRSRRSFPVASSTATESRSRRSRRWPPVVPAC